MKTFAEFTQDELEEKEECGCGCDSEECECEEEEDEMEEGVVDKVRAMNYDRLGKRSQKQGKKKALKAFGTPKNPKNKVSDDEKIELDKEARKDYKKATERKAKASQLRREDMHEFEYDVLAQMDEAIRSQECECGSHDYQMKVGMQGEAEWECSQCGKCTKRQVRRTKSKMYVDDAVMGRTRPFSYE